MSDIELDDGAVFSRAPREEAEFVVEESGAFEKRLAFRDGGEYDGKIVPAKVG